VQDRRGNRALARRERQLRTRQPGRDAVDEIPDDPVTGGAVGQAVRDGAPARTVVQAVGAS
jgi:hypothetical protein